MKKKSRANIPDFSRKGPSALKPQEVQKQVPTRAASGPVGKPQSKSAKSGRRGS